MLIDCVIPCAEHFLQLMLNKMRSARCLGRLALLAFIALQCDCRDTEFNYVTCGSLVKLLNTRHNVRLHSHDVKYGSERTCSLQGGIHSHPKGDSADEEVGGGTSKEAPRVSFSINEYKFSGSGQQSVTGVESSDDANSYWRIRGKPSIPCERGAPIKCGQAIRITHMNTGRNLHTHHFVSPLSGNQEVSAFGENGEGDDLDVWTVQCSGTYWERDEAVRFKHKGTEVFLSVTGEQYNHPIRGQREVHGMPHANHHNYWKTMEGVFIKTSAELGHHDEL